MWKFRRLLKSAALVLSVGILTTAVFAASLPTLTVGPVLRDSAYRLEVNGVVASLTSGAYGYTTQVDSGAPVKVEAPLTEGVKGFLQWNGGPNGTAYSGSSASFTMPEQNVSLTAQYKPVHGIRTSLLSGSLGAPEAIDCWYGPPNETTMGYLAPQTVTRVSGQVPEGAWVYVDASGAAPGGGFWRINTVEVKKAATSSPVTVSQTVDGLSYFVMPDTDVTIEVMLKIGYETPPVIPTQSVISQNGSGGGGSSHSGSGDNGIWYTIVGSAGEGGRIVKEGIRYVPQGSDCRYSVSAEDGWEIGEVLVDGSPVRLDEDNRYWFRNVRRSHTIHVNFYKSAPGNATVSERGNEVESEDGVSPKHPAYTGR